jgi:catechol 2,3-dioxygenase-like lactoylglutathione lyase family enzyme
MEIGWHDLCLKTKNLAASRCFYEALGFDVLREDDHWVSLTNGNLKLSLMTFLDGNLLTFRGADVSAVQRALSDKELAPEGHVETYDERTMGQDGTHWRTTDPDGNPVYFDTMSSEATQAARVAVLLSSIERQLDRLGIESAGFEAFKEELTRGYLDSDPDGADSE